MNLKIRDAALADYDNISNLVIEVHNLHVKNRPDVYLDIQTPFLKEQFEDLLSNSNTKIFVVEDKEELIAYGIVQLIMPKSIPILIQSKFAYIDDFCVKSTHQGNGIGKVLFNHMVDYSKSKGASSIQLNVWEFNENAIAFYESLGMSTRNRRMELRL